MVSQPLSGRTVRFGEFELDLEAQQLRKAGALVRLQPHPFQVLAALARRGGKVVTREELRREVWGNETFVDFEQGLNFCIRQIRVVLGDEAQTPQYVETIPRRGYRFIAPVEGWETTAPLEGERPQTAWTSLFRGSRRVAFVAVSASAVVALAAVALLPRIRSQPLLTDKDTITLGDFSNSTGDPVFDDTLRQALAAQLEQSPFLSILSDQKRRETLQLMGRPTGTQLTQEVARDLCQRVGSRALVEGSIARLGSHYAIGLTAMNCLTGDSLAREEAEATQKEDVLKALDGASAKLRGRLGESISSIQKFDTPIEQATTSSLEALKAYTLGRRSHVDKASDQGEAEAIPLFKRAIELDPKFAMAYASLGACYGNIRENSLASQNVQKAFALRDHISERENLYISAHYYQDTGQLEEALQTYELWAKIYPRDVPLGNLGTIYWELGQHEKALENTLAGISQNPGNSFYYTMSMAEYVALNRLDDAMAAYQKALAAKLDNQGLHHFRYMIAFLQGDAAEIDRQVALTIGKPGAEDLLLNDHAATEAYAGRLKKSREFIAHAIESAKRNGLPEMAAEHEIGQALTEADFGNSQTARQRIAHALPLASTTDLQIAAAVALARAGDTGHAQRIADEVAKKFPETATVNRVSIPEVRAAIELDRRNPSKAIELLQSVSPYELGFADGLYSAYLRGIAYLLLNQGNDAAAQFQKILDHRGIVQWNAPGALAHLGLARAYSLQGEKVKSRAAYEDFFALWKDADPDILVLKQAKSEYAKLL